MINNILQELCIKLDLWEILKWLFTSILGACIAFYIRNKLTIIKSKKFLKSEIKKQSIKLSFLKRHDYDLIMLKHKNIYDLVFAVNIEIKKLSGKIDNDVNILCHNIYRIISFNELVKQFVKNYSTTLAIDNLNPIKPSDNRLPDETQHFKFELESSFYVEDILNPLWKSDNLEHQKAFKEYLKQHDLNNEQFHMF